MVLVVSLILCYGHMLDYCGELWMQLDMGVYLPIHNMVHTLGEQCKCLPFFHALEKCKGMSSKRKHWQKESIYALKATTSDKYHIKA